MLLLNLKFFTFSLAQIHCFTFAVFPYIYCGLFKLSMCYTVSVYVWYYIIKELFVLLLKQVQILSSGS